MRNIHSVVLSAVTAVAFVATSAGAQFNHRADTVNSVAPGATHVAKIADTHLAGSSANAQCMHHYE